MKIIFELFMTFFKIGIFTFGGGHAMIPMINEEIVGHGWLSQMELTQLIAVSESTPGPFAINIATFVGSTQYGFLGSLISTTGVIMPSFLIILIIAIFFHNFSKNKYIKRIISGLNPVIIGLIFAAGFNIVFKSVFAFNDDAKVFTVDYVQIILFTALYALNSLLGKRSHPIFIILIAGALGVLIYSFYTPPSVDYFLSNFIERLSI